MDEAVRLPVRWALLLGGFTVGFLLLLVVLGARNAEEASATTLTEGSGLPAPVSATKAVLPDLPELHELPAIAVPPAQELPELLAPAPVVAPPLVPVVPPAPAPALPALSPVDPSTLVRVPPLVPGIDPLVLLSSGKTKTEVGPSRVLEANPSTSDSPQTLRHRLATFPDAPRTSLTTWSASHETQSLESRGRRSPFAPSRPGTSGGGAASASTRDHRGGPDLAAISVALALLSAVGGRWFPLGSAPFLDRASSVDARPG